VRARAVVAAAGGVAAAAAGHALDAAGQLPFVHESGAIRLAMTPIEVVGWLAAAGVIAGLAAISRPLLVGLPGACAVSGFPELIGRHDPGAILEPGAALGALLQVLILLLVVALAVLVVDQVTTTRPHATTLAAVWRVAQHRRCDTRSWRPADIFRTRGPPPRWATTVLPTLSRGHRCPMHYAAASSWLR
jgi:hypothetical protein